MCGEIDDQLAIGEELQDRLRLLTRAMGLEGEGGGGDVAAPGGLDSEEGRGAYMDAIYRGGLGRALAGIGGAEGDQAVDALACHAIALARLAGFLAGSLPPEADLFRATVSALTAGHGEGAGRAEALANEAERHHHHHHHHHDHDQDHGHHH